MKDVKSCGLYIEKLKVYIHFRFYKFYSDIFF